MDANKNELPKVYEFQFQLVDYYGDRFEFSEDDRYVLAKYGKMRDGFTRTVLVPETMSLASMHYMIQRLFGWRNSHLHNFKLDDSLFDRVTCGNLVEEWLKLCGVLFRFPNEEMGDLYCNDDYDGYINFKSWLKRKYSSKEMKLCIGDTYVDNRRQVMEFNEARKSREFLQATRIDQLERAVDLGGDANSLRESLCVKDVFFVSGAEWAYSMWKNATAAEIERLPKDDTELLHCLAELKMLRPEFDSLRASMGEIAQWKSSDLDTLVEYYKQMDRLEGICTELLPSYEPKVTPFTNTLLYSYDYGDGWCVRVTCMEIYESEVSDSAGKSEQLLAVAKTHKPICISTDGICLLDDVGGIYGFVEMLKALHGKNAVEAENMKEWAKGQGWTGRAVNASAML